MSTITVENLTKRYGSVTAIEDLSFEIPDGEFVVVLGESGAGKSTLLRCLNGLTRPTSGSIIIDDEPVTGPRNDVAMIFQQHNIIKQLSTYSNALTGGLNRASFFRSITGLYSADDKAEAARALDTVGLLDQMEQRAGNLSGGQMQRVGIARALVQQPNLLLADEPVASLDPASAETVMEYIRTASAERDLTTLASLHQVNLARAFGERFLAMKDGDLVFDGYRDDLSMDVIDDIYGGVDTETIEGESHEGGTASTKPTTPHEH